MILIKGAKISDYGGRSITIHPLTIIMVNELSIPAVKELTYWYANEIIDNKIQAEKLMSDLFAVDKDNNVTIKQIKSARLLNNRSQFFTTNGIVKAKEIDYYDACPNITCKKKKVEKDVNNVYMCNVCRTNVIPNQIPRIKVIYFV